jgi:hypothetical protein
MLASFPRTHPLVSLTIALFALTSCQRGGPQAPQANNVAFNFANMERAEETVIKEFKTGAAPRIVVEVFNGPITISAGSKGAVKATVTKYAGAKTKAEAEEALKELAINFTEEKGGIRIAAVLPAGKSFNGGASAKVQVPAGSSLELKTSLGAIDVAGVHGTIRANDSQGPINIKEGQGDIDITTSLAQIDVGTSGSKVVARNSQGGIAVHGATGAVDLATSLAQINVDAPCTTVNAKNSQGGIAIRGATGDVDLVTSLGTIDVDAACASVTAQNSQGTITVKKAKGRLKLTTSLANITVKADGAELEASNSQGAINAHGLKGRVKATSRLAPIAIEAKDAVVEADNSQGPISFTGNLVAGKHSFRTSLAGVTLNLPADASFHINAQVSLGRIRNAFAMSQKEKASETHLVGVVGANPAAMVQVNVSQGDVVIKSYKQK